MSDCKIAVYAIAKNEEKFALRWAGSMAEADEITVLDTGSDDKTVPLLRNCEKVRVFCETVTPWRFDTARNRALALVSADADYCVCTDLDEVFVPGWRAALEAALRPGVTQVRYRYTWSFAPDGSEETVFFADKIHARHGFLWRRPVHETLFFTGPGENRTITAPDVRLLHKPDPAKSRAQYLPLLELAVREDPADDRSVHYLAREYYYHRQYDKAVYWFEKHLALPAAVWADERCASYRYLARCRLQLGDISGAERCFLRACAEAPHLREPWLEFAYRCFEQKNYPAAAALIERALQISAGTPTYITDAAAYGARPYDVLSLAYYYMGDQENARKNAAQALALQPEDARIRANLAFFTAN